MKGLKNFSYFKTKSIDKTKPYLLVVEVMALKSLVARAQSPLERKGTVVTVLKLVI